MENENPYPALAPESTIQVGEINISYHPKAPEYDMYEWVELARAYHEVRGRDVKLVECVTKFEETSEPHPMQSKAESWGVDVQWQ